MLAAAVLPACVAPFKFRYFNAGWFTETQPDAAATADRIEGFCQE